MQTQNEKLPHYVGHRKRQKDKFLKNPPNSFSDYELIELMLFQSIPRKDVKPLAKELLNKFQNDYKTYLEIKNNSSNVPNDFICTYKVIDFLINNDYLDVIMLEESLEDNIFLYDILCDCSNNIDIPDEISNMYTNEINKFKKYLSM